MKENHREVGRASYIVTLCGGLALLVGGLILLLADESAYGLAALGAGAFVVVLAFVSRRGTGKQIRRR